jgi:hypothetical protein
MQNLIFGIRFETWMVALTMGVVGMAIVQVLIYAGIHSTTKRVERAYVDLSHGQPGIEFEADKPIRIQVAITNHGHTPADVVAVVVERFVGNELPDDFPDIRPTEVQNLFLMPNAPLYWTPDEPGLPAVPKASYDAIYDQKNPLTLWIIGYVDYIDRFGKRRRNHFTRKFNPLAKAQSILVQGTFTYVMNNLLIETKVGYSTDMEIDEQGKRKS